MNKLKLATFLAAVAALVASPAYVAAQAGGKPISLGVQLQMKPDGPEIVSVFPGGTAAAAGFKVGDVLLEAGGKPMSPEVLQDYLKQAKEGDPVGFKVKRGDAVIELTGAAARMPADAPPPPTPPQG